MFGLTYSPTLEDDIGVCNPIPKYQSFNTNLLDLERLCNNTSIIRTKSIHSSITFGKLSKIFSLVNLLILILSS
jgi:hypothetical protein